MTHLSREKVTAYLWMYTEINDPWEGKRSTFPMLTDDDKIGYLNEINFGVDQACTDIFLRCFEHCTQTDFEGLLIELKEVPPKTPYYLDDKSDCFSWPRQSYRELKILPGDSSFIQLFPQKGKVELYLTREKAFELFSRLYICNKIYATSWDNIVEIDRLEDNGEKVKRDMVFWGVSDGDPIHY